MAVARHGVVTIRYVLPVLRMQSFFTKWANCSVTLPQQLHCNVVHRLTPLLRGSGSVLS